MSFLTPVPWDTKVFGKSCYEVSDLYLHRIDELRNISGHFTLRLNPLTPSDKIQKFGFRYVDTLIVPVCHKASFLGFPSKDVSLTKKLNWADIEHICCNAFVYGRYHRDCLIPRELAERRYQNWLKNLYGEGKVFGIEYQENLAAFIAVEDSNLILHAVHSNLRGRGLAKYLWTPVCEYLFAKGYASLQSSISATNLAVVNLYISLGFVMRSAHDIYHFHSNVD